MSGAPSFAGTAAQPPACVGNTVPLVAQVSPVPTGFGSSSTGPNIPIPDNVGQPLNIPLEVTGHEAGAVIGSIDEVPDVCVELEHSYMGDLVIVVTCPSGQSVVFHQQGGGSTFLGGANDTDAGTGQVMGECWSYCWSPTATLGTFASCAATGATPNVTQGGTPPASALLPGTYSRLEPMDQLIGCPVDGTWTLSILDNWAVDDG